MTPTFRSEEIILTSYEEVLAVLRECETYQEASKRQPTHVLEDQARRFVTRTGELTVLDLVRDVVAFHDDDDGDQLAERAACVAWDVSNAWRDAERVDSEDSEENLPLDS